MRWPCGSVLLVALTALTLAALALAGGAAGEEANATDEALLTWFSPPQPLVAGVWNSTSVYGYVVNNWTANLTVEVHPQITPGFELIPWEPQTFVLGTYDQGNGTDYYGRVFFYLNVSAATAAPVNTTLEIALQITAWEGNLTPDYLWYNRSFDIRYEPPQPPLEIIMPVNEARIDVRPGTSGRGCLEYQIYNPSAIQVPVWIHYETEPDSSLSMNPSSYPITIAPGNFTSQTRCFQMPLRKAASSHPVRLVVEVRATDGSASYMSATRNFTVEILPYSSPTISSEDLSIRMVQNRRFAIPLNITNNGNAYDRLYVNISNIDALIREGFRFDPLPFKVEVAPFEWTTAWLNGTAPDVILDTEFYDIEIVVNGSYEGWRWNTTYTLYARVAPLPDLPAPPLGAVVLVLVAVASGLRARRGLG